MPNQEEVLTVEQKGVRTLTLFAVLSHIAKLANPRVVDMPSLSDPSLKAITEALILSAQHDPSFYPELNSLTEKTLTLVAQVKMAQTGRSAMP